MTTLTKDDAEVLRILAEARKFEEEAEEAKNRARKELALARKEEHYAENARISAATTARQEQISLAGDYYHHEFHFTVGVNEETVDICSTQLRIWDRLDPECPMTIILDSPGGGAIAGMHLFDEIDRYSLRGGGTHKTTGIVRGWAASMGGILLQAFDERVMGPQATLLIHEVSSWAEGQISDIEDKVDFLKSLSTKVSKKFVERSEGKTTLNKFNTAWKRKEWYLTATEALDAGFIDRIG